MEILYIINDEKYLNYYKDGFMKYVPNFLIPSIRPKIVEDIIIRGNMVGKVIGVNLKPFDVNHKPSLDIFLNDIKKFKTSNDTRLFIEGQEKFNNETMRYIEENTDMKTFNGENIRIKNLYLTIREVYTILKEDPQEKEVLIISDDKDKTKKVIKALANDFRFITAVGYNEEEHEEIYNYILDETGLSLFYTSNIDKILENYSIIINFMENMYIDFSKTRRYSLIFNFGGGEFPSNGNRPPFIEDFAYDANDLEIADNKWIDKKLKTNVYEALLGNEMRKIGYLFAQDRYYTVKDYINLHIKIKGKI